MNYLLFIFILFLSSCTSLRSPHAREADRVVDCFLKDLKKKEEFSVFAYGGAFMYDVEEIDLSLFIKKCVNLEEARILLVSVVESLLAKINTDPGIRPYLHNYPFTDKDLVIFIHLVDENGDDAMPPNIAMISKLRKSVDFSIKENVEGPLSFRDIHTETYEEALKIYNAEK